MEWLLHSNHCEKLFDFYDFLLREFSSLHAKEPQFFLSHVKYPNKMQAWTQTNEQIFSATRAIIIRIIPENYGLIMNEIDPIKFQKNDLNSIA